MSLTSLLLEDWQRLQQTPPSDQCSPSLSSSPTWRCTSGCKSLIHGSCTLSGPWSSGCSHTHSTHTSTHCNNYRVSGAKVLAFSILFTSTNTSILQPPYIVPITAGVAVEKETRKISILTLCDFTMGISPPIPSDLPESTLCWARVCRGASSDKHVYNPQRNTLLPILRVVHL